MLEAPQVIDSQVEIPEIVGKRLITFRLESLQFGIPLLFAQECVELTEITRVPLAPKVLRGLFHRQGRTVSLVHLEPSLGLPLPDRLSANTALIVLIAGVVLAIPAQDIRPGVVPEDSLVPHPNRGAFPALDELADGPVSILHPDRLLAVLKQSISFKTAKL